MARRGKRKTKKVAYMNHYRVRMDMWVFVFIIIFIYMLVCVGMYLAKDKISIYEVSVLGSLTKEKNYTGMILREETVEYATDSGYVNYYIREGGHAGMGNVIYTIDESGQLSEILFSDDKKSLKESNLSDLKSKITSYCMNYNPLFFEDVYNMKIEMDYEILELANSGNIANLNEVILSEQASLFVKGNTISPGTISYYIDGYENYTMEMVSMSDFESGHTKKSLKSGDLLEAGDPVYKTISSDNWSIIFPLGEEDILLYGNRDTMRIQVDKDGFEVTGDFSIVSNANGSYGVIQIENYMVRYLSDRFLSFEIHDAVETGLKIPKTSVVEKSFYMIPKEYLVTTAEDSTGFLVDGYNVEKQEQESSFVSPVIYYADDNYYYVGVDAFSVGTYLTQKDSNTRYQIGATQNLKGVYSVNQGYTVFRLIQILTENDEYYIVKTGIRYGISLYDHIILNSKTVQENQIIYR